MKPEDNGEKKPLPKLTEKDKDAFIAVLLITLENLTKKKAIFSIKREALDTFPNKNGPVFVWDNSKEHWSVMLPEPKKKILTPNKRIIGA